MERVSTSTTLPRVTVRRVTHRFDEGHATGVDAGHTLDDVSLDFADGEFVSIIGPSGCGKTTLLNVIAGFLPPTGGAVHIDGRPVEGIQRERVAFMFARDNLLPWRTALANVLLPLECGSAHKKGARSEHRRTAESLLERVGLGEASHKYPHELSHGMRQRVALARTLACDSEIILMDEPFGALDAQTRVLVQKEFAEIWEEYRKTVVMVTHDLTEAIALSDRIVVMSHRPARIKRIYDVELPRPRVVLDLPAQPAFHALYSSLWNDLRSELVADAP